MKIIVTNESQLEELIAKSTQKAVELAFSKKEKRDSQKVNFNIQETADYLRVSKQTIRNYIKAGHIEAKKVDRIILINRYWLENNLEKIKSLKYKR